MGHTCGGGSREEVWEPFDPVQGLDEVLLLLGPEDADQVKAALKDGEGQEAEDAKQAQIDEDADKKAAAKAAAAYAANQEAA